MTVLLYKCDLQYLAQNFSVFQNCSIHHTGDKKLDVSPKNVIIDKVL